MGFFDFYKKSFKRKDTEEQIMSSLTDEIFQVAREQNYIPSGELPFIPELKNYGNDLINIACTYINNDMKTIGLGTEEMVGVFSFIFMRAFDFAYQWHMSSDGMIDSTINVGNIYNDDCMLTMPSELKAMLKPIPAPRIIANIMINWWQNNHNKLKDKQIDIWLPLGTALTLTYSIAISMALKVFCYRE